MLKKYRFHIGLTLLVQSASFVVLFFLLYNKKKSLANTFLALSAIGGISGAYLVLKEAKSEVEACEQAAKDACEYNACGEAFEFEACEDCMGECDACTSGEPECEITIEEYVEEAPVLDEIAETVEDVVEDVVEEAVEEEPAEDIFAERAAE
ncbi:MAG: hypothetical protein IJW77_18540 [Clostridia bacterium]|nr:hypothetical protein [Clostridia bacterium]